MTGTAGFYEAIRIVLGNGAEFNRPEERIREYCEIEVYRDINYRGGYDDHHAVTDSVNGDDIEAANNLFASIDSRERMRIVGSVEIPPRLAAVRDLDLGGIQDEEWGDVRAHVSQLLHVFLSIPNVDLAKSTKLLQLKRPHLFPVLDSFVVKFLTGNDMNKNKFTEDEQLQIGLTCLDVARSDLIRSHEAFAELESRLGDLTTPLTVVRLYDILCWTQEKWVNNGNSSGRFGTASRSLNQGGGPTPAPVPAGDHPGAAAKPQIVGEIRSTKEFRQVKLRAEGVVVNTASSPPRAHRPLCVELTEERFQTAVIFNEGKEGRYYLRTTLAEAVKDFGAVACKKCKPERPVRPA